MKTYEILFVLFLTALIGCMKGTPKSAELNSTQHFEINQITNTGNILTYDLGYPHIENILESYEHNIKRYANRYGFDWRLILALMNQESRFQIEAVSPMGAYGLMQIMPKTGQEVSSILYIESVKEPEDNIAGGIYYLWWTYSLFMQDPDFGYSKATEDDRLMLALAAYNGGPSRVKAAQDIATYLYLDPYRWSIIRSILPLLSPRYYTLHQYVWESGKPEGGYFSGYMETINYVDSVMEFYSHYQHIF